MSASPPFVIAGRSSSHFTRLTRMFALELGVECHFEPIHDLSSRIASTYAGNPALKLPILRTPRGDWFGSLPICRELARNATRDVRIAWPEAQLDPLSCNAIELTLQGMATEVSLIMQGSAASANGAPSTKLRASLEQSVAWLDANIDAALAALPSERDLSVLEVALFCFGTHLPFRDVMSLDAYPVLARFCADYAGRPAAAATVYRFDPQPT